MIFTETMRERKQLMQENSDACIVLPGGIGTLEEFLRYSRSSSSAVTTAPSCF